MSRLKLIDIAQRGVTLGLFGVTMYGAAIFVDGGKSRASAESLPKDAKMRVMYKH